MHAPENISAYSRQILDQIEYHPTTHNIAWSDLVDMLKEVADVEVSHGGAKAVVRLGDLKEEFTETEGEPVNEKTVLALRRMFKEAGFM
ncbi:hypothetical protein [Herbiconiux daphne]|uniref:Type II toxin-antitoxin system HicA family toxin n=1 Tax=Herbiconiux daphne TaxID=2970914 RepID=A0ABT2H1S3_9MICO|nr:hypothetical protein [Herbiconiux daphne]MCS5733856.1 hypothetical protein [Herbiconiux daphne]